MSIKYFWNFRRSSFDKFLYMQTDKVPFLSSLPIILMPLRSGKRTSVFPVNSLKSSKSGRLKKSINLPLSRNNTRS